jgi:hypothetical protein
MLRRVTTTVALSVIASIGVLAAPTSGAETRLVGYPTDLNTAVMQAYPDLTLIRRTCEVTLNNGRSLGALAVVTLRGGARDLGGFDFINTAGWFNMWRYGRTTRGVPRTQVANVKQEIRTLKAACGARWR